MISSKEIESTAEKFCLQPQQVEKDYVHSWILWAINSRPELKKRLVLKGGNALRKCYFSETRFSKDLDFSSVDNFSQTLLETELREVCRIVEKQTGVTFKDADATVREKKLPIPDVKALEARIYFKGFYNDENCTLKTQFDVTQFDKIYLPPQEQSIIHPYSDSGLCRGTITCQKAEEVLASKLTTLLHRRKAGDLFDLFYSLVFQREKQINRQELIITFLKKSIFEPRPNDARKELLSVPIGDFNLSWKDLFVPVASVFSFDYVLEQFTTLINALFDLVLPESQYRNLGGGIGSGYPNRIVDFSYCPGNVRNAILEAGRNRRLIEMTYSGYRRLVEPYRLEYYVRKKDGVGNEYLWGWDTIGGQSSEPGIKMFFA
ncbi:nucleotidyl transferase AbiEii/AbiGii toxin family protein, partial [Methyloglobulus morosus]|uniref:nucleotidyl transferase AbiEii/AbiGii toxin family protein n=1 Tax=Methyloglobulus morosus TaxID=1410681 RepID=UPI0005648C35